MATKSDGADDVSDKEKEILRSIIGGFDDKNALQIRAALRIQRQARRKSAWKVAQSENQWKLFSDLDTRDEADMLSLAIFMQTLLDSVPGTSDLNNQLNDDEEEKGDTGISIESIRIAPGNSAGVALGNCQDFDLPKGDITASVAMDIVQLYRQNGRLSLKSVQKILRTNYKSYKLLPNTTRVTLDGRAKLNVIGDIHGQLSDLFHILDDAGTPGPNNIYVFNGDFVDRGTSGIEVICVLLALHAALPEYVILNRGNHEDHAICTVYGFQRECKEKYDELTFGMFAEVFRYLPLFTIVNDALFIIHGGLFHDRNVRLADLEQIDRTDYLPKPPTPYPQCAAGLDAAGQKSEYLKQLQRDALWSDPEDRNGVGRSVRGAGVHFGPDVTKEFLDNNGLKMIIRSHECVRRGFEQPFSGASAPYLCTIFSASNYSGGDNDGAYLMFSTHQMTGATQVKNCQMWYYVRQFKTSEAQETLLNTNMTSLQGLILKKKNALTVDFQAADTENSGLLTKSIWAEIMSNVTGIKIRWLTTINLIAPPECIKENHIDYNMFLESFSTKVGDGAGNLMDCMYAQRSKLEAIFYYFDKDGNGTISRAEFAQGCDMLNTTLPQDQQLKDYDHILDMMDFDQSDSIDINEFFEVFRILDAKDGQLDGIISIAK
eukprot:CAMPEP_0182427696 /NCGR_PEP_ID=MMETSP1167-20130531/18986_1 /TAXON_ID=2988 /ORGANISM="Mallomonas Sp, Strain CCMP3275" /LENGTH=658 /DNA_ID=CAMNT_0024610119 /DNA_START=197 /DNA_END=2173 /DNA_ORIENTATION=+